MAVIETVRLMCWTWISSSTTWPTTASGATYGAVGEAVGIHHQHLKDEPQFYRRDPRTAWVVYAKTRQPPPEVHAPRSSDSRLFTDGGKLVTAVLARKAR